MEIHSVHPTHEGRSTTFTGQVYRTPVHEGVAPGFLSVNLIHFSPGARTAWHSHDLGQTLIVVEGEGIAQARGEKAISLRAGDVVSSPPGEEHWHGADAEHFMAHYSLVENHPDGDAVRWGALVDESDYRLALDNLSD
ncbi:MAG: cupin domain-containing protein [Acidobacteria bacterium]|nr:cupin domain-containing protein [Acidobacteriota bacterium]